MEYIDRYNIFEIPLDVLSIQSFAEEQKKEKERLEREKRNKSVKGGEGERKKFYSFEKIVDAYRAADKE